MNNVEMQEIEELVKLDKAEKFRNFRENNGKVKGHEARLVWQYVRRNPRYIKEYSELKAIEKEIIEQINSDANFDEYVDGKLEMAEAVFSYRWCISEPLSPNTVKAPDDLVFKRRETAFLKLSEFQKWSECLLRMEKAFQSPGIYRVKNTSLDDTLAVAVLDLFTSPQLLAEDIFNKSKRLISADVKLFQLDSTSYNALVQNLFCYVKLEEQNEHKKIFERDYLEHWQKRKSKKQNSKLVANEKSEIDFKEKTSEFAKVASYSPHVFLAGKSKRSRTE